MRYFHAMLHELLLLLLLTPLLLIIFKSHFPMSMRLYTCCLFVCGSTKIITDNHIPESNHDPTRKEE